ncbi:MAG: hypothetical protein ACKVYV_07020 [Limisphaerales bacterium]
MLKSVHLTLLVGPVVPVPVPQIVVDALTSVKVTSAAGQVGGFELSFTLTNHSPLQTIFLLGAAQAPLLRVILVATVNGLPDVLADGVITRTQVGAGGTPGVTQLTVIGEDLTRVMDLVDLSGFPYPAMPPEVRVLTILARYAMFGMIPLVIPSIALDVPIPTDRIPKQQGTDLKYVQALAEEAGYVFYIAPGPLPGMNTAYWGPEIKVGIPQPALNHDLDADRNVESLNLGYNSADAVLPIVMIQNQLTRIPIPIPIPNFNPLQPPLGVMPPLPINISFLRDTAKDSPMKALGRGLAEAARSSEAVSGSGSLDVTRYGRLLKSRGLVGVRGAGLAFDGLYFVKSVTTHLKRGELKQDFELTRNALVSITPVVPA